MFAGGAWQGAVVMLAFGAGTLPNLLLAGFMLERAKRWLDMRALRYSASALMIAFGLLGVWRVLDMPQSSAQGLICLVPMPHMRSAAIE
jgi:sulfite exporter TauE/SafE